MNKKIYLIVVLCVIFRLTHLTKGNVLFHWNFDGPIGQELISEADRISAVNLKMFNNPEIMGYIKYSKPNPWFNTNGTSAEFVNDRVHKNHGAAIAAIDIGENTILDLSTLHAFTIEFFLCPYGINDCVLIGKSGGAGKYSVELLSDGQIRFTINSDDNNISSMPGIIRHSSWYHIAAVFNQQDNQVPMKLYVDGILVSAGGATQRVRDSSNSFCIGTHLDRNNDPPKHDSYINKYSGRLDEVRISNAPLEPNEFLLNAISTKARYPYPENQADRCSITTYLTWRPSKDAMSQRVYFGTNPADLPLIAELSSDVTRLNNNQIEGKLEINTTYYWRVDSKANSDYEFDDDGKGDIWTFTTQGDRVDDGYLRWLLHLGQNPNDCLFGDYWYSYKLQSLVEDGDERPKPGEIYDLEDQYPSWDCPASRDMLIWTPQYSTTGFFEGYGFEGRRVHFYHIYIISPEEHDARLHVWAYSDVMAWNNGTLLYQSGSGYNARERYQDFVLERGVNSMTFQIGSSINYDIEYDYECHYLGVRLTDCNDHAFTDVSYSLTPPLPDMDVLATRRLPEEYGSNGMCDVMLGVNFNSATEPNMVTVIEYIPEGLTVADAGEGHVVGNSISWTIDPDQAVSWSINYSLAVPSDYRGIVPFLGYVYCDQSLTKIMGDETIFHELPRSPADMAAEIDTIEIDTQNYIDGENVTIEDIGVLFSGIRASSDGGWAQYEFDITYPGRYQILLEYVEYWTMFHHGANMVLFIDGEKLVETTLFPNLHNYVVNVKDANYSRGPLKANRDAQWIVAIVALTEGRHTLRLLMEPLGVSNEQKELSSEGRPVINRITLTNYPGLSVPGIVEPHHLDSYEHPPARLVHDRDIQILPDGRVEMKYYGTFYSLSQGNEIYFAQGHVRPKPGGYTSKFEIISFEPEVFHLWPGGELDFVLTICSREPLPEDYSELVVVWLQGTPSCPARKPYLFTTGQSYVTLPPYKPPELNWCGRALLDHVHYVSRKVNVDMTDPPDAFVPDRDDLGFGEGRYRRGLGDFFADQFAAGKLPTVEHLFAQRGWDYDNRVGPHGQMPWDDIWSEIMGSLYWRNIPEQAEAVVRRISENMVFYPVSIRWDWARPYYLPAGVFDSIGGKFTLAAHVRAAQEGLVDDNEQFRILHNLVLPVLTSHWDELRVTGTLAKNANEGDTHIYFDRPSYGKTGSPIDGFDNYGEGYVKIDGEPHPRSQIGGNNKITLTTPLSKSYPKGTSVSSWAYREDLELEGRDLRSLVNIAGASRDYAVIDEATHTISEILEKQHVFLADGSFRNQPGSYGTGNDYYRIPMMLRGLFGERSVANITPEVWQKLHNGLIYTCQFPFSNGMVPSLTATGSDNQLPRSYFLGLESLEELFPEDQENITRYRRVTEQETLRIPGDQIDNENFVIHGWGYAMLRSENGSWDRGMETLLASKFLISDPGDKVSNDCLGIVIYGLGTILTPRYGSAWLRGLPPCTNQVMVDNDADWWRNRYYGSFWHFDGRKELPCAVAHTGDGINSSALSVHRSRWCIQFPEYLFDAYFVEASDPNLHQYDWSLINMGEIEIVEPQSLVWQPCPQFLDGYWPEPGTWGAGDRSIAFIPGGRIVADWHISDDPWTPYENPALLRYTPAHSGRLRLIASNDGPSSLINAQIGYYDQPDRFQANSQDILVIRKQAVTHAFFDTLEPIAEDEQAYVKDVVVVDRGLHNQQLVKVITTEGEDWIYFSGEWNARPDGEQPVTSISTDADIVVWRVNNNTVKRVYIAGGSYADTPHGSWDFSYHGNHYTADNDGG